MELMNNQNTLIVVMETITIPFVLVFDISNRLSPSFVAIFEVPQTGDFHIDSFEDRLFFGAANVLLVYDLSKTSTPVLLHNFTLEQSTPKKKNSK
jgi:hypothetical protein